VKSVGRAVTEQIPCRSQTGKKDVSTGTCDTGQRGVTGLTMVDSGRELEAGLILGKRKAR
jgi:hypothetical protein